MKLQIKKDSWVILMKRAILVSLVLNMCLWFSPEEIASSSGEEPLAVIISIEGTVTIRRRHESRPSTAKEEDQLYRGDIITTTPLSHVTLLYLHEKLIRIPEKQEVEITDKLSIPEPGRFDKLKYVLSAAYTGMKSSLFPRPISSSPGAARKWLRLLEAEIIDLVTPVATKVMTPYPHFKWLPLQRIGKYEIVIFDGLGDVMWSHETTKIELDYPKEAPTLIPGEYYFWRVNGVDGNYRESDPRKNLYVTFGMAYFTVMHEKEITEINKNVEEAKQVIGPHQDEIFNLLLGIYYEKKQLYGEAQEEYQKLIKLKPTNGIYRKMLANLYGKIGRKWAAVKLLEE